MRLTSTAWTLEMANYDEENVISRNMLLTLGECQHNYRRAAEVFTQRFNIQKSHMAFLRLETRLLKTGAIHNKTRHRLKSMTNDANSAMILAAVNVNPNVSIRQLAEDSGISYTSIRRILRQNKYHPYHVCLHQNLFGNDFQNRITFCTWLRERVINDCSFLSLILFTDEATFCNTGQVNRHNLHY